MKPKRIQRKRTKGWKMPENTIYVGRPTKWGNPFRIGQTINGELIGNNMSNIKLDAENVLLAYGFYLDNTDMGLHIKIEAPKELKGKNLACFCPEGQPCHADILLEIANQ